MSAIIQQANKHSQFTKHLIQYFQLLSSAAKSTHVGKSAQGSEVKLSGVSRVKGVRLSPLDWESIQKDISTSKNDTLELSSIAEAHAKAFAASVRSKKDLWQQYLEYPITSSPVPPNPRDAPLITYYDAHVRRFDGEDSDVLPTYLTSNRQWSRQGIHKDTPEQMQVFKMQDYMASFQGEELEKRVSTEKLNATRQRWAQWHARSGSEALTSMGQVNHEFLNDFHPFPQLQEPRLLIRDQILTLKRARILAGTRRARRVRRARETRRQARAQQEL